MTNGRGGYRIYGNIPHIKETDMYFDTHAHYDDARFDPDRDELLGKMPKNGVELIVNPGCDGASSLAAMGFAERYGHVYAAVGWHPEHADDFDGGSADRLRRWAGGPKVVALGEIGLDYYYGDGPDRETQKRVFYAQLELARELGLPVIVHDRQAHADCFEAVRAFPGLRGVFHCYSGSAEMARQLLELGWYLGFTGAVTFKNARRALEAIGACPMDRLMLETDSPYLAPVPHRGHRNDSTLLPLVAETVARVKGISVEEVAAITLENGKRFFGIDTDGRAAVGEGCGGGGV